MRAIATIVVACSGLVSLSTARAQDYPSRPLQMVMPFPPGGIVDIMGRGFAQEFHYKYPKIMHSYWYRVRPEPVYI